ncbi:MAG: SRPBCC family protein [Nocardioides sp.]
MHVERTFSVAQSPRQVFDYLGDFTRTEEWDPGTVSTTRTSGDGGLGTTYANTSEFMGRRVELTYETTVFEPTSELKFFGTQDKSTAQDWLRFTALPDGGTSIHYRADFHFSFPLNLVAPLVLKVKLPALADETVTQLQRVLSERDTP